MAATAQACAGVLQARQRLGEGQRRDAIDAELRDAETRLAERRQSAARIRRP